MTEKLKELMVTEKAKGELDSLAMETNTKTYSEMIEKLVNFYRLHKVALDDMKD